MKKLKYTPPKTECLASYTDEALLMRASFAVHQDTTNGGNDILWDQPINDNDDDDFSAGAKHNDFGLWNRVGSSNTHKSLWDD